VNVDRDPLVVKSESLNDDSGSRNDEGKPLNVDCDSLIVM